MNESIESLMNSIILILRLMISVNCILVIYLNEKYFIKSNQPNFPYCKHLFYCEAVENKKIADMRFSFYVSMINDLSRFYRFVPRLFKQFEVICSEILRAHILVPFVPVSRCLSRFHKLGMICVCVLMLMR